MAKWGVPKATTATRTAGVPLAGEVLYDQDEKAMYYGDGATPGGVPLHTRSQETAYVYGIDYDTTNSSAAGTKVVLNHDHDKQDDPLRYLSVAEFVKTPAHTFKSCVMDVANKTIAYFLDVSDATKKEDGTAAKLDGTDGDVMVRIPITHYRKDEYHVDVGGVDHKHIVWLVSDREFVGSAIHPWFYTSNGGATATVQYIGKFPGVLCDSTGAPKVQSDENTPVAFATGDKLRSIAGARPCASITRHNARVAAENNGGTQPNALFRWWVCLMAAIDGGTFNAQAGISIGYSNLSAYFYSALRKTGRTAVYGNQSGEILADETEETGLDLDLLTMASGGGNLWNAGAQADHNKRVVSFCWRGLEDLWGARWEFIDGCQKNQGGTDTITSDGVVYDRYPAGNNGTTAYAWKNGDVVIYTASATPAVNAATYSDNTKTTDRSKPVTAYTEDHSASGLWVTNNTAKYGDCDSDMGAGQAGEHFPADGYTGASYAWINHPWPKLVGSIKTFDPLTFYCITVGGSDSTYFGDYFYNDVNAGARVLAVGGTAYYGGYVGPGCVYASIALSSSAAIIGCRLAASGA